MGARSLNWGLICFSLMTLAATAAGQQCKNIGVANVKSIFAIAPSPEGSDVLFYGSSEEAEGEFVTGGLFRLRSDGTQSRVERLKAPDASNPPPPVWQHDGSCAYFVTDDGIYQLTAASGMLALVWKGPAEGLAISPNGFLLAFWRVEKGSNVLIVYDLNKKTEVRHWKVANRFEGDESGWDLAFAPDGQALYARAYDQANRSPIERFEVSTGRVTDVSPNAYAVAQAKEAVYFIAVSGAARSLQKIAASSRPILVTDHFDYDSLTVSGKLNSLVLQNYRTRQMAVLDTRTDAVRPLGTHESATVLADGKLLFAHGGRIEIGDSSCEALRRRHK
jgi:hypothetical protein